MSYKGPSFKIKAWAKSTYARITLNRYTLAFFVFSFLYCVVQGMIQSFLFSLDSDYSTLVNGIVHASDIPKVNMTFLEGSTGRRHLQMCKDIPHGQSPYPCETVFLSTSDSPKYGGVSTLNPPRDVFDLSGWERGLNISRLFDDPQDRDLLTGVRVQILGEAPSVGLTQRCIQTLVFPSQVLINLKREDIAWICLQFWLIGISVLAILNDSVPHTLAVLMTRFISTAWALYAIWRGPCFRARWEELIADPGTPCSLEVFNAYWSRRRGFELADGVLSTTALVIFLYLSWTLLKVYNAQSFKCVGAPPHVVRINRFFMAVLACLQMEAFVLVTGMSLWIDILINTAIAGISEYTRLYLAGFIFSAVFLLPWVALGWYSIRREMKKLMIAFLAIGLVIITGWCVMFYSIVYRWSFMQWPYLGCFTTASLTLLLASMILGVVCWLNFGKGLAQYLHAEETLAKLNFAPDKFAHKSETASIRSFVEYPKDAHTLADSTDIHYIHADALRKGDEESIIQSIDTASTYSTTPTRDSHLYGSDRRGDSGSDEDGSGRSRVMAGAVRRPDDVEFGAPAGRGPVINITSTNRQAPVRF